MQKASSLYSETAFQYNNQGSWIEIKPLMIFILGGSMDFFNTADVADDILTDLDFDKPKGRRLIMKTRMRWRN